MPKYILNYTFQKEDKRDLKYSLPVHMIGALPTKADLLKYLPPVYDQLQLGSCTANATSANIRTRLKLEKLPDVPPSRLFIYYNSRLLEGTVKEDSGSTLRDSTKCVYKYGYCSEIIWPYDISKFTVKPGTVCQKEAAKHLVKKYEAVPQEINHIKSCIVGGFPISFGFKVFASFESEQMAKTGLMTMPQPGEAELGGHAVLIIGYDDNMIINGQKGAALIRNSWSDRWGIKGNFWMPYKFLLDYRLCNDFWKITLTD
jgi:C1A family cysteine protease